MSNTNINELLAAAIRAGQTITVNITQPQPLFTTPYITVMDDVVAERDEDDVWDDSDFDYDDEVVVSHVCKDGEVIMTKGIVESFGHDDRGDYVRITGANGKHYKVGINEGEERLGSKAIRV